MFNDIKTNERRTTNTSNVRTHQMKNRIKYFKCK